MENAIIILKRYMFLVNLDDIVFIVFYHVESIAGIIAQKGKLKRPLNTFNKKAQQ
jgi:hypothetical protein